MRPEHRILIPQGSWRTLTHKLRKCQRESNLAFQLPSSFLLVLKYSFQVNTVIFFFLFDWQKQVACDTWFVICLLSCGAIVSVTKESSWHHFTLNTSLTACRGHNLLLYSITGFHTAGVYHCHIVPIRSLIEGDNKQDWFWHKLVLPRRRVLGLHFLLLPRLQCAHIQNLIWIWQSAVALWRCRQEFWR